MKDPRSSQEALETYTALMRNIDLPESVKAAVRAQARCGAQTVSDGPAAANAPKARNTASSTPPTRFRARRMRWAGIAACLALAAGIGITALVASPTDPAQPASENQGTGDQANLVSSSALPAGNFFTLTAYADEANQPAAAGTTIELDASGIRPVSYNNAWIDPETGETANGREFAGMKAGMNSSVIGNNVEAVTYSIEGEGAYLETLVDIPTTELPRDEGALGQMAVWSVEQSRAKSFTLDYDDVALDNGMTLGDVSTILSIYLKVPVPEETLKGWDEASAANDAQGYSTDEGFSAIRSANSNASKALDIAGSEILSTCKLTLTATFADGSTQTKTYAIGLVPDYQQRITDYWDALNESGYDYELALAKGEEPSAEAIAKAESSPAEPSLYTLTEL